MKEETDRETEFFARKHKKTFSDLDLMILEKADEIRVTENYKKVVEWLKNRKRITDEEIRQICNDPEDRIEINGVINVLCAEGNLEMINGRYYSLVGKSDEEIEKIYEKKIKSEKYTTLKSLLGLAGVGIAGFGLLFGVVTCNTKSQYDYSSPSYQYNSSTGSYAGSTEQAEQLRMADEYSLTDEEKAIKDEYEREVDRRLGYE